MAAAAAGTQIGQMLPQNRLSASNGTTPLQQPASLHDEAGMVPRMTVQEKQNTDSRQYLRPPPSNIREAFSTLRLRHDIPRPWPPPVDISRYRERGDSQPLRGARPKETWHRSGLSVAERNGEDYYDERTELDVNSSREGEGSYELISHQDLLSFLSSDVE